MSKNKNKSTKPNVKRDMKSEPTMVERKKQKETVIRINNKKPQISFQNINKTQER